MNEGVARRWRAMHWAISLGLLLSTTAASAQTAPSSCAREGVPRSDDELEAFVDVALAHGLQYGGISDATVWDGELVACALAHGAADRTCLRAGRVDAVLSASASGSGGAEVTATVVPTATPGRVEVWSIRPLAGRERVRVVWRGRRWRSTSAASPFYTHRARRGRVIASRDGQVVDAADPLASHMRAVQIGLRSVDSVRLRGSRVLFFTGAGDTYPATTRVVAVVRDDGTVHRSCQIDPDSVGRIVMEEVLDLSRLGAPGALGALVRSSSLGYSYDLGYSVQLWSLVPVEDGGLAVSKITLAEWSGSAQDREEPMYRRYRGWERRFEVLGRGRARLAAPIWREAVAFDDPPYTRRMTRTRPTDDDRRTPHGPIAVRFDALGFVPPPPPDDEERTSDSDEDE